MKFIDEATIQISSGHGGPGSISFRREKYVPRGGPDGGEGGKGGDVIFYSDAQLSTLQDFRFKRIYAAENGVHGSGGNKTGRNGKDIRIRVPVGTVIRDAETQQILHDFVEDGETWVAAVGGRGGKGNAHFTTARFQTPKFAQPGEEGQSHKIKLELRLLADVGIIGYPNAGKSTLISRISAAKPKIADYEFTTLTPNLGVVFREDSKSFVVADIPGLIDGAHRGLGLGHKFLRHIERTRLFIHVLDGTRLLEVATLPDEWKENPEESDVFKEVIDEILKMYRAIRQELKLYNEALIHKPEVLVLNKADLFESEPTILSRAREALRREIARIRGEAPLNEEPFIISSATGNGLEPLLQHTENVFFELKRKDTSLPSHSDQPVLPNDPSTWKKESPSEEPTVTVGGQIKRLRRPPSGEED